MPRRERLLPRAEPRRELKNYEMTPRPVFALLALLAVQIITLIHRKGRVEN
jgi:hypothetical protein